MVVGLTIFGVNYAVLLGLITAILDIIPIVGPAVALVICLVATFESGWGAIIAVLWVFAVAQVVENNFVRTYISSKYHYAVGCKV